MLCVLCEPVGQELLSQSGWVLEGCKPEHASVKHDSDSISRVLKFLVSLSSRDAGLYLDAYSCFPPPPFFFNHRCRSVPEYLPKIVRVQSNH